MNQDNILLMTDVDFEGPVFSTTGSQKIAIVRAESYGGGTVSIQIREKNSDGYFASNGWHTITNAVFSGDDEVRVDYFAYGAEVRAVLSGSSGASNVRVVVL